MNPIPQIPVLDVCVRCGKRYPAHLNDGSNLCGACRAPVRQGLSPLVWVAAVAVVVAVAVWLMVRS